MPNKNYISGRTFEYKVKKIFEKNGFLVFRSAGSHSIADLIAFQPSSWDPEILRPLLIQCKHHGKISKDDLKIAFRMMTKFDVKYLIAEMVKRKFVLSSLIDVNGVVMRCPCVLEELVI